SIRVPSTTLFRSFQPRRARSCCSRVGCATKCPQIRRSRKGSASASITTGSDGLGLQAGSAAQCAPHETRQCLRSPAASPPTRERTLPPTCLSFRCLEAAFDTQAWWTWLLSYLFAFALRSRASCSARSYPRLSSLSTSTTWLSLLPNGRESPINLSRE